AMDRIADVHAALVGRRRLALARFRRAESRHARPATVALIASADVVVDVTAVLAGRRVRRNAGARPVTGVVRAVVQIGKTRRPGGEERDAGACAHAVAVVRAALRAAT